MECGTIKQGRECHFWASQGCSYTGGACNTITERCEGCANVEEWPTGKYCKVYADPVAKWAFGSCNFATHVDAPEVAEQVSTNPLKASKRASASRRK